MTTTNLREFRESMRSTFAEVEQALNQSAQDMAEIVVEHIQSQLPPDGSYSRFPGYASNGTLRDSISILAKGHLFAVVGIDGDDKLQMIAFVHEYGMKIAPGTLMRFRIGDRWISTYEVTIKPKGFFEGGFREAEIEIGRRIEGIVTRYWPI